MNPRDSLGESKEKNRKSGRLAYQTKEKIKGRIYYLFSIGEKEFIELQL